MSQQNVIQDKQIKLELVTVVTNTPTLRLHTGLNALYAKGVIVKLLHGSGVKTCTAEMKINRILLMMSFYLMV